MTWWLQICSAAFIGGWASSAFRRVLCRLDDRRRVRLWRALVAKGIPSDEE